MKKIIAIFGLGIITIGVVIAVFILIMALNQFPLMNHLPVEQQYFMGLILTIMFIAFGLIILKN